MRIMQKYAAIRNDKVARLPEDERLIAEGAMDMLTRLGVLENPRRGDPEEFWLMKLKDINTAHGLLGYAREAAKTDLELAADVLDTATRSLLHPSRKQPD